MNPNACDTDRGPCACGAWHVMPAPEEQERLRRLMTEPSILEKDAPPKTLLKAAKDLRSAQRDYMVIRGVRPEGDAIREFAGMRVAQEAAELDRAIEATERRQLAPVAAIHGMPRVPSYSEQAVPAGETAEHVGLAGQLVVREPSISEQHAMGVPSTGGEVTP